MGENYDEAYDKLLHDIKPKLTGLKNNENEESWGNGVFKRPWVVCEDLREELRVKCNIILALIKSGPKPPIDDDTPPTIFIVYDGGYSEDLPGVWKFFIEDLESGIDEVLVEIDGSLYFHDQNLNGMQS